MPRRPDFSLVLPDPRIDRYRERVARLRRGGDVVGHLLVRAEPWAAIVAGHLWWRQWSQPSEALWLWVTVDDVFMDHWLTEPDSIGAEVETWDRGEFRLFDEVLAAEWLSDQDSHEASNSVFGV